MGILTGYNGPYGGSTAVVEAICKQAFLDVTLPAAPLAARIFNKHFMPYAKLHWQYDGMRCNCEHLSGALLDTWYYIKTTKSPRNVLPPAEVVLVKGPLVARALPIFAGPAKGNINAMNSGNLDGRCYFALHALCKIGTTYFDPTYNQSSFSGEYFVEARVRTVESLRITEDSKLLYARNLTPAPQFSDSWDEMNAKGWISAGDWKIKTARTGHYRSKDLENVDTALANFQDQGASGLAALKSAFQQWYSRNSNEADARNRDGCIEGLARFLGVPLRAHR
jgi:hypothetical protein